MLHTRSLYHISLVLVMYMTFTSACDLYRGGNSSEKRLLKELFDDYNKDIRPVLDSSHQVQVELEMIITKMISLDTKTQTLTTLGWLSVNWTDERLTWNLTNFNISHVVIDSSRLWLPDFTLVNSGDGSIFGDRSFKYFKVVLYQNGSLFWRTSGKFVSDCAIDITYFPFDEQVCSFDFINWAYSADQVNLTYSKKGTERFFKRYTVNSEWDIIHVSVKRKDGHYNFDPESYPQVIYTVIFKRKPMFYVVNIIILTICFAFLLLTSFKLPIRSGERISMVVSLLVAFSVMILSIQHSIPETSQAVPVITIYMVCFMFINTLGIFATVFVLYLYHHNPRSRTPTWLKTVIVNCGRINLRNIFCKFWKGPRIKKTSSYERLNIQFEGQSYDCNSLINKSTDDTQATPTKCVYRGRRIRHKVPTKAPIPTRMVKPLTHEWEGIAKAADKACFWLFLILFGSLISIMMIVIASGNSDVRKLLQDDRAE